ncbi:MAG: aspartate kinase [Chitinophagaceae bacterium]|nr:MAG: aspartate kinase [Chitinophagaceae bacterium]
MKVFKFGGASVSSLERIKNTGEILGSFTEGNLLVVISAMGKTTNALEKVAEAFFAGRQDDALLLFEQVKKEHLKTAKYLLVTEYLACEARLKDFFTEVEWMLHDKPVRAFDYYYDQVVCAGELLSTAIMSHYLTETGIENTWIDVRDIFRTDNNFRDAKIDWDYSLSQVRMHVLPALSGRMVITQGFIGATDENESTTLGREGSDYTAAVFANMLNAESQTIWKDVPSVMNADPRKFPEAQPIHELNYREVIEMAYYGAQVIHPKTIKPLQNKGIPLYVKCFLDPSLPGTVISNQRLKSLPPIIVLKENQVLLELSTLDYSFAGDEHLAQLYRLFDTLKVRPNLTQNGAIGVLCVLDDHPEKIEKLALDASGIFDVTVSRGLSLLTIRHYDEATEKRLTTGKKSWLKQQTAETLQVLIGEQAGA